MALSSRTVLFAIKRDFTSNLKPSLSRKCHHSTWKIPLSEVLPSAPVPVYSSVQNLNQETKVTTLSNGLKVASQNKFGQNCTVGVFVESGSRFEVSYPSGISHFLEKLAFNSTTEFANRDAVLGELEKHGGICDCQSSRDALVYAASAHSRSLDPVIRLLGETVLRPRLLKEEVVAAGETIKFELSDLEMRPDQEQYMLELIHQAAYRSNTLGLPKLCPPENVSQMDRATLFTYMKQHFTPSRMVVAGVGIEHQDLLDACHKYFVATPPIWETEKLASSEIIPVDNSISQYTGGEMKVDRDMSVLQFGPSPMPDLAYFALGLESCAHGHPDFVPACVLNTLMGGGGSFSAGGPGKGMYTRLYTRLLNRHHWMYSCTAYNNAYSDSGLFCITASAPPKKLGQLVEVIVDEVRDLLGAITQEELERAKIQLQSVLLMNLESRPVVFEDIGRQVLATAERKDPEYFIQEIAKVSSDDIHRLASHLLRCPASVAALGDLSALPSLNDVNAMLASTNKRKKSSFSLF